MTRFQTIARWFLINGAVMAAAIGAVFYEITPLEHIVTFLVWFFFVLSFGSLSEAACDAIFSREHALFKYIPRWVDISYDVAMVAILLYPGWYATAAAYTIFTVLQESAYSEWEKRQEKENEQDDSGGGSPRES